MHTVQATKCQLWFTPLRLLHGCSQHQNRGEGGPLRVGGGVALFPTRFKEPVELVLQFQFQVSSFKFQVSSFKFQVSSSKFQVSSSKFQVPSFKVQVSNFSFQIRSFKFQVSSFKFQISSFKLQVSSFKFQVSGLKFQVPSFQTNRVMKVWFENMKRPWIGPLRHCCFRFVSISSPLDIGGKYRPVLCLSPLDIGGKQISPGLMP